MRLFAPAPFSHLSDPNYSWQSCARTRHGSKMPPGKLKSSPGPPARFTVLVVLSPHTAASTKLPRPARGGTTHFPLHLHLKIFTKRRGLLLRIPQQSATTSPPRANSQLPYPFAEAAVAALPQPPPKIKTRCKTSKMKTMRPATRRRKTTKTTSLTRTSKAPTPTAIRRGNIHPN